MNYVLRIFDINDLWQYNAITITVAFIIFIFAGLKFGVMGVRLKFERYRLDSAMRSITSGTAILNHTLKNEIVKIDMCTNNIRSSANSHDQNLNDINENLDYILESTGFIMKMIKRIQKHVQDIVLIEQVNNLKKVSAEALVMVRPLLKEKRITVQNNITTDIFILCDAIHIQEALHNLFKNAIEAMDTGGRLTVDVNENRTYIEVLVKDTGSGISRENLPHIFDPFYTTKKTDINFGLGLSYCFNVMQRHGGTLEINSEKNIGTTVLLFFPKAKVVGSPDNRIKGGIADGKDKSYDCR